MRFFPKLSLAREDIRPVVVAAVVPTAAAVPTAAGSSIGGSVPFRACARASVRLSRDGPDAVDDPAAVDAPYVKNITILILFKHTTLGRSGARAVVSFRAATVHFWWVHSVHTAAGTTK